VKVHKCDEHGKVYCVLVRSMIRREIVSFPNSWLKQGFRPMEEGRGRRLALRLAPAIFPEFAPKWSDQHFHLWV